MTDPIALIRAALDEAATYLDSQCLTDEEVNEGISFTPHFPAVAAIAIRAIDPAAILRRVQEGQE
jgi:hypothetical protein